MNPIPFKEQNAVVGAGQPEYIPLPVLHEGLRVTSCWRTTWRDRLRILFTGRIYVTCLTFGAPLQPLMVNSELPDAL